MQESTPETWQHLLEPNAKETEAIASRQKTTKHYEPFANKEKYLTDHLRCEIRYSKEDMIKMLQPYLFDPLHCRSSVITVLPVHVQYDNLEGQKLVRDHFSHKRILFPLEECKEFDRARWIPPKQNKNKSKY